jgi:glycosyltransferase involved in cell wall biosynthesis
MKISLCLLLWNELDGCKLDVPQLPRDEFIEIFAVDGGSTDGSIEYLESQGIPVHRQAKRGLNAAYWQGIELAKGEAVVFFFPKGTLPCGDLRKFRPLLEAGCQMVVASRNVAGGRNEEDGHLWKPRKWMVKALSMLASALWRREGHRIRDVLHGVRAFTVEGFRRMDPSDSGLSIDLETTVRSYRRRLKRAEFPTCEIARPFGYTHFKALPTGIKLLRFLGRELRRPAPEITS